MKTLEQIEALCEKDGPCWIWTGAMDDRGRPTMHWNGSTKAVRRVVRELVDGAPVPDGLQAAAGCGCTQCVSPECSVNVTAKVRAQMAARRGVFNRPDALLKMTLALRAKSHITDEMVKRCREFDGTCDEAAQASGISLSHTKAIRSGRARKDIRSPFVGLGAR